MKLYFQLNDNENIMNGGDEDNNNDNENNNNNDENNDENNEENNEEKNNKKENNDEESDNEEEASLLQQYINEDNETDASSVKSEEMTKTKPRGKTSKRGGRGRKKN
jgi:hypothetical protein